MKSTWVLVLVAGCCPPEPAKQVTIGKPTTLEPPAPPRPSIDQKDLAWEGEVHLKNVHALTFGADNAEAYWSFAGDKLIMQTNRPPYKCDQIEEISVAGGPSKLVSTGKGRTTCSFFMKGDKEIIFASTHESSPECPTPPDMSKGYFWGLFEYDIYKANADGTNLRKLAGEKGYDAEATVCPVDGSIIFTSVRSGDLELWRMDADGKNLKQLTDMPGYDGGAVFSPDCTRIAWRASRPQGKDLDEYKELLAQKLVKPTKMDLWVANADGSDARQITYLPGASFGPYFYPSGKRIIFSSNYVNPRGPEFDLYGIDIDGTHLERLTFAPSFDGFPMFSPDGKKLSFSSNRRNDIIQKDGKDVYRITGTPAGEHDTNVFVADWVEPPASSPPSSPETAPAERFITDVGYLADDAREGRGVGTRGLADAQQYVQKQLEAAGVEPGLKGGWRQPFEVTVSLEREAGTAVMLDDGKVLDAEFAPYSYAKTTPAKGAVVYIGSGIVDADAKVDDYKGKDVRGKIVVLHSILPPDVSADLTRKWSALRRRVFVARGHGAAAVIAIDDGDPARKEARLPMLEPSHGDAGLPVVQLSRKAGAALATGDHTAEIKIALKPVKATAENIVGVIRAGSATKQPGVVVVGAHVDHLGMGGPFALDDKVAVHNGADDNASGVAALLEAARALGKRRAELDRDVYFTVFSAEEMGVLGSTYMIKNPITKDPIIAMINMDMVGRMRKNHLSVNGGDSAKEWKELVEPACKAARVDCSIAGSGYGPSDHMPFYVAGVPVLFLFTGNHPDYHTANDDTDKINAAGGARVALIAADAAVAVGKHKGKLTYVKAAPERPVPAECKDPKHADDPACAVDDRPRNASLGTIPSYDERDKTAPPGLIISGVGSGGPAEKAGLKGGDRIVDVGGTTIDNINDLMFVLQAAKPGQATTITFVRDGKRVTVEAVFGVPGRR